MTRPRSWLTGAVRFVIAAAMLLAPWPGLPGAFVRAFAAVAQFFGSDVSSLGPDSWEAAVRVVDARGEAGFAMDTRRGLYLPLAVFTALCAAAPVVRLRRRVLLWALGLAALQLLPALTFVLVAGPQSGLIAALAAMAYKVLVAMPAMAHAVPGLLFLVLWSRLERRARPASPGGRNVTARRWSSARGSSSTVPGRPRS